jgi:hypothetical protein
MATGERRTIAGDRGIVVGDRHTAENERRAGVIQRRVELQAAWREASAPFTDTRPEMLELREERRMEARNSLIEFCRTHREELPKANYRDWAIRMLRTFGDSARRLAETAERASAAMAEEGHPATGSK